MAGCARTEHALTSWSVSFALVAGTIATEIAIRAAKIVRTNVMAELSGEATVTVNLHARSCDDGASNRRI